MKKPEALIQLLEELRSENIDSPVVAQQGAEATIYPSVKSANDENGIHLNERDSRLIFSSKSTVERLMEALGDPADASLTITGLDIPGDVVDVLEQKFIAVDEE